MFLHVNVPGLSETSTAIGEIVADLIHAHTTNNPIIAGIIPPGSDAVSLANTNNLHVLSASHHALTNEGIANTARSGAGVAASAQNYATLNSLHAISLGG